MPATGRTRAGSPSLTARRPTRTPPNSRILDPPHHLFGVTISRCTWVGPDALMQRYHDREWGVPVHNDRTHFEFLLLEGAQAGLSWAIVLNKRDGYRRAFSQFDPQKVARFTDNRRRKLMLDPGIVRNRLKIDAAVRNARAFLAVQEEFGSFNAYCWRFVGGEPLVGRRKSMRDVPASSPESDLFSRDLKQRGFSFVGSTVLYAYMQAVGLVNDHLMTCFRYPQVRRLSSASSKATVGGPRSKGDGRHPLGPARGRRLR